MSPSVIAIRTLNDAYRAAGPRAGGWVLTQGVLELGAHDVALAIGAVQAFADFTPDNDPYGEHDFGSAYDRRSDALLEDRLL
jgi:hypothetical protein